MKLLFIQVNDDTALAHSANMSNEIVVLKLNLKPFHIFTNFTLKDFKNNHLLIAKKKKLYDISLRLKSEIMLQMLQSFASIK